MEQPDLVFLLVFDGDREIGFAKIQKNKANLDGITSDKAFALRRLYIIKEYHGKGAGRELLQVCIDMAKQQKYDTLWLSVWERNTKAIAFYEKYGFKIISSHEFTLGNDIQTDFLMKKEL